MPKSIEEVLSHPLVQAFNPENKRFLEARWLSERLNPGASYGIRMAALIPFTIFPHIKAIPSFQMLKEDFEAGRYEGIHTLVVPSSGNTAHGVARLAPAFGLNVKVVLAADVPDSKKAILEALSSVYVISVPKGESTAQVALEESKRPGHYLLDQYGHEGNPRAHELYTGPEVIRACRGPIEAVAASMGSGGTIAGLSHYLKRHCPGCHIIGVRPVLGQQVPGTRDEKRMAEVVTLPWRKAVDNVIDGSRHISFDAMRKLWSEVEPQPGPSSGLAYIGLVKWFTSLAEDDRVKLKGKTIAFICPDDGRFYSERTTGELDPHEGLV